MKTVSQIGTCRRGYGMGVTNDKMVAGLLQQGEFIVPYPGGELHLGKKTHVMGILNVTPDSFYDGKRYTTLEEAIHHARRMVEEGADIIDVGGESTRPGAYPVPEKQELRRVIPVIKALSKHITKPISIDTYKSNVAREAIKAGANIINDIGSLRMDRDMARVAAMAKVPVVIMHNRGTPNTMHNRPLTNGIDIITEIVSYLQKSVSLANSAGIDKKRIIIDPGIGFGKTLQQNLEILRRLGELRNTGFPVLIGPSRKRFIGDILGLSADERMYGTLATVAIAVMNGAHIVRVHDVREVVHVVTICDAVRGHLYDRKNI